MYARRRLINSRTISLTIISDDNDFNKIKWYKKLKDTKQPWSQTITSSGPHADGEDRVLYVDSTYNKDKKINSVSVIGRLLVTWSPDASTTVNTTGKQGSKPNHPVPVSNELKVFATCSADPQEILDLRNEANLFAKHPGLQSLQGTVVPWHRGSYTIKKLEDRTKIAAVISVYDFQAAPKLTCPLGNLELPFM